jgi:solute carrier family 25 citrate transporter 1
MLAMYKGLLPRLMRIAPGQAIVWTVNDQIVQMFEKRQLAEAS